MSLNPETSPTRALRDPNLVMRLDRLGASFPTRLSFMRRLLRALIAQKAEVTRPVWDIDAQGHGRAVLSVPLGGHVYSLIAYSNAIPDDARTDRVIAEVWDTTFALFDGVPSTADLDRLASEVPRQEAGRMQPTELTLSRANKSMRLFAHVADALATGQQPDAAQIGAIGYLMRTTAVYGNGKFGIADRDRFKHRAVLDGPFAAEMLTVWLIRQFTLDLVEHVARAKGGDKAVPLDARLKRHLGIGNSTGLGMAPFLVNHPGLLHAWVQARETALARVLDAPADVAALTALLARAKAHVAEWSVDDPVQMPRIEVLRAELETLNPISLWADVQDKSAECQELAVAVLLEAHPALVDDLCEQMCDDNAPSFNTALSTARMRDKLERAYGWALAIDLKAPGAQDLFWYVSEDKLEPRLGERHEIPGADRESPLDIARQVQAFDLDLREADPGAPLASLLMTAPEHRRIARRVQAVADLPYAEVRDNVLDVATRPIDLLRAKLAVFGASKFDPKSDRWTRVTLFQGAPLAEEVAAGTATDDWSFPVLG